MSWSYYSLTACQKNLNTRNNIGNSIRNRLVPKRFGFSSFWGNSGPVLGRKLTFFGALYTHFLPILLSRIFLHFSVNMINMDSSIGHVVGRGCGCMGIEACDDCWKGNVRQILWYRQLKTHYKYADMILPKCPLNTVTALQICIDTF